jgi:methyl-accepting chemotaxis protein
MKKRESKHHGASAQGAGPGKQKGFKSIRLAMVLPITLLSIAICAVFYIAAINLSSSAVTDVMESSLNKITKQGAELVTERINRYNSELEGVTRDSAFKTATVSKFQSASENMYQIQTIMSAQVKSKGYLSMVYADANGNAYNSAGDTLNVADNINYAKSMAGEQYVSDPAPVAGTDQTTMTFSVPVKSGDAVIGVLMMTVDGYALCDQISDLTYAKTGYAYIVNSDGIMVAHPDRTMVYSQDRSLEKAQNDPQQKGLADLLSLAISGQSGVHGYNYKGVTKYAGYVPIQGTHWYMVLTAPRSEVFAQVDQLQWVLLAAAALLALLSALVAFLIANGIAKPILPMVKVAERFSAGDLDIDVDVQQRNEIGVLGKAFQAVSINMSQLIASIRTAAEQVAVGSRQVASSGMQLASGTTQQASALEELSASVEEIASQTRQNANHASEANQLADNTRSLAVRGNEKMSGMLRAMEDIDQSSGNINRIIKVIDDIAFQTNILALNAAVEAARAGEHGRGFAVVAEEVRNLAAKSASAAQETGSLIESSSKSVAGGAKLARETADALKQIVNEIERVATLVHGISVASSEQSTGIEQINQGLVQISQVVQANSATTQQTAAASRQLTAQADTLNQQVAGFKLKKNSQEMYSMPGEARRPEKAPAFQNAARFAPTIASSAKSAALEKPVKAGKPAPIPPKPARPVNNAPIPHSVRAAASAAVNAAFARPTKISLGEEDDALPPERPARISLGEGDRTPGRPRTISLSDNEFGKY